MTEPAAPPAPPATKTAAPRPDMGATDMGVTPVKIQPFVLPDRPVTWMPEAKAENGWRSYGTPVRHESHPVPFPYVSPGPMPSPARIPTLPLNQDGSVQGGLEKVVPALLGKNRGLYWGDDHGKSATVDTLKRLLPDMKKSGVNSIFIEMFEVSDQEVLTQFERDGNKDALKKYLVVHHWNHNRGESSPWVDHVVDMLVVAREQKIKIYGVGFQGSYEFTKGIEHERVGQQLRLAACNPYWAKIVTQTPKTGKYIVFGGSAHGLNVTIDRQEFISVSRRLGIPSLTPLTFDTDFKKAIYPTNLPPGQVKPNPNKQQGNFIFAPLQNNAVR